MLNEYMDEFSYRTFSDLLTGYRLSAVLMQAHDSGVFDAVGPEGGESAEICARMGWEPAYGDRFLRCLGGLGLLIRTGSGYALGPFASTYLCSASPHYQGNTLLFERQLQASWTQLTATLGAGKRVFATGDKDSRALQKAFSTFLGAMDEAAAIRARELWSWLPVAASGGIILDTGAGSGAYLSDFLRRYSAWTGIFCDLPEVVADSSLHQRLAGTADRLRWCGCNLLADGPSDFDLIAGQSCDLVLLSNIIHCQGAEETEGLLRKAAAKTRDRGLLVVHDFFSDGGWRGALYDIHMMLNTFNGRTYPLPDIIAMASACGFRHSTAGRLPSGSTALVLARDAEVLTSLPG